MTLVVPRNVLIALGLALAFAAISWLLMATTPENEKRRAVPGLPVVDAMVVEAGSHAVTVRGFGTVRPARELELRPQVEGRVIAMHADFEPGGLIPAGQPVIALDDADYRLDLAEAENELARAEAEITLEQGRQVVAREEFRLLEGEMRFDEASTALVLREPQLKQVIADRDAAAGRVEQARLALERTKLTLPFDTVVLEAEAVQGEFVAAREVVGRVARADTYWVELRVRQAELLRLESAEQGRSGSQAVVRPNGVGGVAYEGHVARIRAELAEETRLGGVIVAVADPLARQPHHSGRPPLLIGSHVEAEIDAGAIVDVVRAPRRAVRDNGQVLVADADNRLHARRALVRWEQPDAVLLANVFEPGDRIITSRLSGVIPGAALTVNEVDPFAPDAAETDTIRQMVERDGSQTEASEADPPERNRPARERREERTRETTSEAS